MRIAVDARHGSAGRGVARYLRSVLAAWPAGDELVEVPGSRPAFTAAALAGRPRLDRMAGGADAAWLPAPAPVAVSDDVPLVLTLHDLSWVRRPQDFTAYERLWHRAGRIPRLAARADRVVAVSRATAEEAIATWGLDPARVRVILNGPGLPAEPGGPPAAGVDHVVGHRGRPTYVLCVGAREPRKAQDLLARAHARAANRGLDAALVFAGDGSVGDAELDALYRGALAVVHPAHLEGFGFPPVEALARGVPAIVADLPVYAETVGEGALRFPPGDEEALADALLRIERDEALRARLVTAGAAAVAELSWERCAADLRAVLAEVAR